MTAQTAAVRPPIPATCEHRPTIGGFVVPWVNVQLADGGVDFRSQHNAKAVRCWTERRCQVCSRALTHPAVVLCGPSELRSLLFTREPPVHPECAAYTSHACPVVGGRVAHVRAGAPLAHGRRGQTCPEPGCDCAGWFPTPGLEQARDDQPRPAHPWYAVYLSGFELAATADRPDAVAGGVARPDQVLAVRLVSTPDDGRVWRRVTDPLADYRPPEAAPAGEDHRR